jgi:hypothetical protein
MLRSLPTVRSSPDRHTKLTGDPLPCPRCGGRKKIVSFIIAAQRDVIDRILDHGGLASLAPPAISASRTLTHVSDAELGQDPGPAEPDWLLE